jgi:hypothetical protein
MAFCLARVPLPFFVDGLARFAHLLSSAKLRPMQMKGDGSPHEKEDLFLVLAGWRGVKHSALRELSYFLGSNELIHFLR